MCKIKKNLLLIRCRLTKLSFHHKKLWLISLSYFQMVSLLPMPTIIVCSGKSLKKALFCTFFALSGGTFFKHLPCSSKQFSLVTVIKHKAIKLLFCCTEVTSSWPITSKLANQQVQKTLFISVVYTCSNLCQTRF